MNRGDENSVGWRWCLLIVGCIVCVIAIVAIILASVALSKANSVANQITTTDSPVPTQPPPEGSILGGVFRDNEQLAFNVHVAENAGGKNRNGHVSLLEKLNRMRSIENGKADDDKVPELV